MTTSLGNMTTSLGAPYFQSNPAEDSQEVWRVQSF